MTDSLSVNRRWVEAVNQVLIDGLESAPRGSKIKEILGTQMIFDMNKPILTLASRQMNYRFAFGEAWWILSGSNDVDGPRGISQFMKSYSRFSDDGVTMGGAYGPKFVDQLSWVVNQLVNDQDTRQAVINIWREKPGNSKDIPCTLSQQYFIREGMLHVVATMRSNDLIWGTCYDTFTFTMMAKMVQTMLAGRGIDVELGFMILNAGSLHIYEDYWAKAQEMIDAKELHDSNWVRFQRAKSTPGFEVAYDALDKKFNNRQEMLDWLYESAEWFRKTN